MALFPCNIGSSGGTIYVKKLGVRSYSGNTQGTNAQLHFDVGKYTTIKIGSRDSGITTAVIYYYDSSDTRTTTSIPTSGVTDTIPSSAVRFAIIAAKTGSTPDSGLFIYDIEIS